MAEWLREHLPDLNHAPGTSTATSHAPTSEVVLLDPTKIALPDGGFDLDAWNRAVIVAALAKHQGSPVRTAAYLKVTRKVLYTLRKRYGLIDVGEEEPT